MSRQYLTTTELAGLLSGVNWGTLFTGTGQPAAGQAQLCMQASDEVDRICAENVFEAAKPYTLHATLDTEVATTNQRERVLINDEGNLSFLCAYRPVITVIAATVVPVVGAGMTGGTPWTVDLTNIGVDGREVTLYGYFSYYKGAGVPLRVNLTYLNGFANAVLTAQAAAGATSLLLDDLTGFTPGQVVRIYDAGSVAPEDIVVASTFVPPTTTGPNPGSLPLTAGTEATHAAGIRVSAMPASVQQAALYLAIDLIQKRSAQGFRPAAIATGSTQGAAGQFDYRAAAKELLESFVLSY